MKIKKSDEAIKDLHRYIELLKETEDYEDRDFLMTGIINIDRRYRHGKFQQQFEYEDIKQAIENSIYNYQSIADYCCVSLSDVKDVVEGDRPNQRTLKKMYVGITTYDL